MACDEGLVQRVREQLAERPEIAEKRMFGGVAFLHRGNLCCGVSRDDLIVRVGPAQHTAALALPHAHVFDITGRPMTGWIRVAPQGVEADAELGAWISRGLAFASTLPAK